MKILLDENIPIQLKKYLPGDDKWFTVRELGWQGTKNGKLLMRMRENDFEGLITMDKSLYKQNHPDDLNFLIIAIRARDNKINTLTRAIPELLQLISSSSKGFFEVRI